jgi:uncharacterized protein (DUF1800 family)
MVRTYWHYPSLIVLAIALPAAAQTISISPTSATVRLDSTHQFSRSLSGASNTAVTWSVNGVDGGNATVGAISTEGLYTPPVNMPNPTSVTVRVTSVANPTKFANATVNLQYPVPTTSSITPGDLNIGTHTLTVTGTKFYPGAQILLQGSPVTTQFISSTQLRTTVNLPTAQQYCIVVANPTPNAGNSSSRCFTVRNPITISISPTTATVRGGATRSFTTSVGNTNTKDVDWLVNGVLGGNATVGAITSDGLFTAPLNIAAVGGSVKVGVRSRKDPTKMAESTVTLLNPVPVLSSIAPTNLPLGTANFTITGNGFAPGATVSVGGVPMRATVNSLTSISVSGTTQPTPGGVAAITVSNPAPGPTTSAPLVVNITPANPKVSYTAAKRFLEQASWGASPAEIFRVMEMGFDAWLEDQRQQPASTYTMPTPNGGIPVCDMQAEFFNNAMNNRDQLRQRVAYSLHKIFVVSAVEVPTTHGLVPYHRLLLRDALGNVKALIKDITLDVGMGEYLDMVNNIKANPSKGTEPNENYARELMQLFTLGTVFLRADGSPLRDPNGNPYPAYTEADVIALSKALTGWTYPPGKGTTTNNNNKPNYGAPMVAVEANHDTSAKTILGRTIPPGQTAMQDLDSALQIIFDHPNIAPFLAYRLIQSHVTSNPSGAYQMRVVQAFHNNGRGEKGDLFAVIKAILLDPEARAGDNPAVPNPFQNFAGRLREPVLSFLHMLKGLEGAIVLDNPVEARIERLGQKIFYPPSVFSYYSPFSRVPGNAAFAGPEFQILTPVTALERVNYIENLLQDSNNANAEARPNLAPYIALASDVESLILAIDRHFLNGAMPEVMKQGIRDTLATTTDPLRRARLALYLALTSANYQIQQ